MGRPDCHAGPDGRPGARLEQRVSRDHKRGTIVEAPCCTASGGILPLTDFGTASITGSLANGSALGNAGGVTQIIMIDSAGRDKDTVSSLSGGENFTATWLRSN